MPKQDYLAIIAEKLDALYQKLENEDEEDLLLHLSESAEPTFTSLVCFDESHSKYGTYMVYMTTFNVKDGFTQSNTIYNGNVREAANQVFLGLLNALDGTAIHKDEDGIYSM